MLSSKPLPLSSQAFHLTTVWHCADWFDRRFCTQLQASASFLTNFWSDHRMALCWLVWQRVPYSALSLASFLTIFPSDHCLELCWLVWHRVLHSALNPAYFFTIFWSDHHVALCWLVWHGVLHSALNPTSFFTTFHPTTMWQCWLVWQRVLHSAPNPASFFTIFWSDHRVVPFCLVGCTVIWVRFSIQMIEVYVVWLQLI